MKRTLVLSLAVPTLLLLAVWSGCSSTDNTVFSPAKKDAGQGDVSQDGTAGGAGKDGGGGSAQDGGAGQGQGGGAAGQGQGGTSAGGTAGSGGTEGDAMPDVDFTYDAPPETAAEACAAVNVEAKLKPLDMYFMIDRSGSMSGTPWTQEGNALNAFWTDPNSTGITAALRYFPISDSCVSQDPQCSGNAYVNPIVNWGLLPANAAALSASFAATGTNGCTPTQEALNGVLKGSKQRQIQQPGHVVVAVMVSDGAPCCGDCPDETAAGMGAIAQTFYNGTPSIRTFALYVAAAASDVMTQIASGGGTNQAYDATNTQNFINALKAIQGTAIPCDFDMPVPDAGLVDLKQVTLDTGGTPINKVDDASLCGANGGWYFDNNTAPTKITLCPVTCTTLKADPSAKVNVSLGCLGS